MWSRSSNMSDDFLLDFARLRVHTMGDPFLLCAILLLILNQEVSSAVKQEHVQTGKDVYLHIQPPDLIEGAYGLTWKFNTKINVAKYDFTDKKTLTFRNYQGRVTFYVGNGSLLLKNLTKRDSGLYTAVILKDEDKTVTVNVTVHDGVSPVNLTVVSKFPGLDSCNLTVTCCSQNSSVTNTFTCDHTPHCSQEGGASSEVMTSAGLLSVHMSEGSVICNHSNQVSLSKETTPLCQLDSVPGGSRDQSTLRIGILSVVGCICGIAAIAIGIYLQRRWRTQRTGNAAIDVPNTTNTTYDSVQFQSSDPAMTNPNAANGHHPEHGDTSTTIYSLLQHPPGFVPTATTETSNTTPTNPESLYAQVQKPDRR